MPLGTVASSAYYALFLITISVVDSKHYHIHVHSGADAMNGGILYVIAARLSAEATKENESKSINSKMQKQTNDPAIACVFYAESK